MNIKNSAFSLSDNHSRGGIILSLLSVLFLLSVVAAVGVGFILWQDMRQQGVPSALQGNSLFPLIGLGQNPAERELETETDTLEPQFIVDEELTSQSEELEASLLTPLRAYYATKKEQLGTVHVIPSPSEKHTTQVTYELQLTDDTKATHTFFYDREGEDEDGKYPMWEPSLLDKTE